MTLEIQSLTGDPLSLVGVSAAMDKACTSLEDAKTLLTSGYYAVTTTLQDGRVADIIVVAQLAERLKDTGYRVIRKKT